jgi:radical SAM superfamily enzyme YgiQ (UPF0313 family)
MLFSNDLAPFGSKKVLLVQPKIDGSDPFWDFGASNAYVGAKATHTPHSLATLADLLPRGWEPKIVDMNIEKLRDKDIRKADFVFVTGMIIHRNSIAWVIKRAACFGKQVVVGGPFATITPEAKELDGATAIYIGEAEGQAAFNKLLSDIGAGIVLEPVYRASGFSDMAKCSKPRYDLVRMGKYVAAAVQASRGCLQHCDFCVIHKLYGTLRYKTPQQVVDELESLYRLGHRRNVFFVDDDFPGRRREAEAIVDAIIVWQKKRGFPFLFYTQSDISLGIGSGLGLAKKMFEAGFYAVFLGLESPSKKAMLESGKILNANNDAVLVCSNLRKVGLFPHCGGIVGFDSDGLDCFSAMSEFINECRVPVAMVGMLTALPGTALYERVEKEGRLTSDATGDASAFANIKPRSMTAQELHNGYRSLMADLYAPENYFRRATEALDELSSVRERKPVLNEYLAALRSMVKQGIMSRYCRPYWRFIGRFLFTNKVGLAFTLAILFVHLYQYARDVAAHRADQEPSQK